MLNTSVVLLLALASPPSPSPTSPGPIVAHGISLAQAGPPGDGWRGAPPPAPPVERFRPRRGFVWVDGNYEWRGGQYVWTRGHYERARPGRAWHGGRWEWQGNHYVWIRGAWIEGEVVAPAPQVVIETPPPPPPLPQAAPPAMPPPRPGFVWIPGAQEWRDGRYVWVEGHWEAERRGDNWHPGHWDRQGDHHAWHQGGWEHGGAPVGAVSITGRIVDRDGRPVPGITVVLAGTSEGRAVTDGNGGYAFTGLAPGSYSVRPNDPRCSFGPDVVNLNNVAGGVTRDFNAACRR